APGQHKLVMAGDPIAIGAPTPIQATASDVVVQMQPLTGLSMVTQQTTGEPGTEAVCLRASYPGGAQEDRDLSAAIDTSSGVTQLAVAGWSGSQADSVVTAAKIAGDLTSATQAALQGVNAKGRGIDVDATGTTYVVGNAVIDGAPRA